MGSMISSVTKFPGIFTCVAEQLIQGKREAFGGTAGFEDLVQVERVRRVAAIFEHGHGFRTSRRQHHVTADAHGVARKPRGFGMGHDDTSPFVHAVRNRGLGVGVECRRIVQQFAVAERAIAGVQVLEPARDQFQRQYFFAADVA